MGGVHVHNNITIALSWPPHALVVSLICCDVEFDLCNCSGRVETLWTCSGTWADYQYVRKMVRD